MWLSEIFARPSKIMCQTFYNKMLHVINCMIRKFASSLQNVIFEKEKREERLVKLEQKKISELS